MDELHAGLMVAVIALVTLFLRSLPFLLFGGKRKTPVFITYLSNVLPYAIMGMLVVYCLKAVSIVQFPFGVPELVSVLAVVVLHVWKRNNLLSIGVGTVLYMALVQTVFAAA